MAEPLLRYPFDDSISTYADEMEQMTREWLQNDYSFLPPEVRTRYAKTKTGYLTARFFPHASKERLVALSMCSLWGLAFDDYYEHADLKTYDILRKKIGAIIRGEAVAGKDTNAFYRQMAIIAKKFRSWMPEHWMHRFAHSMEKYIDGMIEESVYKREQLFPTPKEYENIRWKSVDVLQMIDGVEVATELPLSDLVRHHPHMEAIAVLVCRIIAWCNDYFSVQKETGRDVMNLILVLQYAYKQSRADAVSKLLLQHDVDLGKYRQLTATLPDFGREQAAVTKFIEYNNLMIAGHWRWYITDTLRYKSGGSPAIDAFADVPAS
ncbi:hypothetical protein [Chitinophaga sp. OAE865]|uniref:terpene synthase family protein n=1 Tax=Chitinophaga sp. OAE865 TaxID=2817898 RepID=UPI001AE29EBE